MKFDSCTIHGRRYGDGQVNGKRVPVGEVSVML